MAKSSLESLHSSNSYFYVIEFDYVVKEQVKTRLAFGSTQGRSVMPLAGTRSCVNRLTNLGLRATDNLQHLSPAEYATHRAPGTTKVVSTKGLGTGARLAGRFKDVNQHFPAPNAYNVPRATAIAKPAKVPFNSASRRKLYVISAVPGPGTYSCDAIDWARRTEIQPVVVKCGAGKPPGICEGCGNDVPVGCEFWTLGKLVLCETCMMRMRQGTRHLDRGDTSASKFRRWQLEFFKKTRDCSDVHLHEGTAAKIYLLDPAAVEKRRRRENYLARYFKDYTVNDREAIPGTIPAKLVEKEESEPLPPKDEYCCLHEAFNSFNKDRMSFGFGSHNFSIVKPCLKETFNQNE